MNPVGQYILSISAAAMICVVIDSLVKKGSAGAEVIRLLTGLFMLLVVIRPLLSIDLTQAAYDTRELFIQGESIAEDAQEQALEARREIISAGIQAYILDKAENMDTQLSVEVEFLQESDVPVSVILSGDISPYNKMRLQQTIENELGIHREEQIWNP